VERAALRRLLFLVASLAAFLVPAAGAQTPAPRVLVVEFDNDINPVTRDWVTGEIERAEREGYSAVVIELDTPGGLVDSMEDIVQAELRARVPVVVYVAPAGAEATSAGAFVAQAADVLAMAPNTTIGSSTPITGQGNLEGDVRRKAVNKLASQLRGLARSHGRNARWADAAVRRASNVNAAEALQRDVVDLVSPSLPALLAQVDGRKTIPKGLVLETSGAQVERSEMGLWKSLLDLLIDPNIIFLMMSIGLIGIVVELWNPGLIFPGTVGAVSLIVGLYGLQVLPVSIAGILLMLLALAFIAAEPFVVSHGALAVAGLVCFVIGALMLFDPAGPAYQVSLPFALSVAGTIGAIMALVVVKLMQVRRAPVEVGVHHVVGAEGVVRRDGLVFAEGELWRARSADGEPLRTGEPVAVEAVDGLELVVKPLRDSAPVS
jgi:membrane-bound serine protease (ClpP class)